MNGSSIDRVLELVTNTCALASPSFTFSFTSLGAPPCPLSELARHPSPLPIPPFRSILAASFPFPYEFLQSRCDLGCILPVFPVFHLQRSVRSRMAAHVTAKLHDRLPTRSYAGIPPLFRALPKHARSNCVRRVQLGYDLAIRKSTGV